MRHQADSGDSDEPAQADLILLLAQIQSCSCRICCSPAQISLMLYNIFVVIEHVHNCKAFLIKCIVLRLR